jgi:hypothetical protein
MTYYANYAGSYALSRCRYLYFALTRGFLASVCAHVWAHVHVRSAPLAAIYSSPSRNHRVRAKYK